MLCLMKERKLIMKMKKPKNYKPKKLTKEDKKELIKLFPEIRTKRK